MTISVTTLKQLCRKWHDLEQKRKKSHKVQRTLSDLQKIIENKVEAHLQAKKPKGMTETLSCREVTYVISTTTKSGNVSYKTELLKQITAKQFEKLQQSAPTKTETHISVIVK